MTQRAVMPMNKAIRGMLAAALTSGVFIASALGPTPAANATCASFFGIGNGNGCTSSSTGIAIAIGTNATATATGLLGAAIAIGTRSAALSNRQTDGIFAFAVALGENGLVVANGTAALAVGIGTNSNAAAGAAPAHQSEIGNIAIDLGDHDVLAGHEAVALGTGNIAIDVGNNNAKVAAIGRLNYATNLLGTNTVESGNASTAGTAGLAFSIFGKGNTVTSGPGPFAVAGSIFQNGSTVNKSGPGFNINGVKVGGAAAPAKATTKKQTGGSAAAVKHTKK